ncbi:response regulator transcription factor [Aquimarina macrocephali]|uniref:response regulator transcription factor n=1 Tax=Aquimarina macrocephali TaxID=666563 RepID=UPI000464D056|nr:response regulator transcription factor [Aquimarina macrocephali]
MKEVQLTKREIDVIVLIAQEFTTKEISDKLFLSKHTIEDYRKNLISKLNVRNLAGLTKYAVINKLCEL